MTSYDRLGSLKNAERNLAAVRAAYIGIDSGDVEAFFRLWADDAVAHEADGLPYGGTYRGKEACRRCFETMISHWEAVTWTLKELAAGGDTVVVMCNVTFTPKKSGAAFTMPVVETWEFKNEKIVEVRAYYYDTHFTREAYLAGSADPYPIA